MTDKTNEKDNTITIDREIYESHLANEVKNARDAGEYSASRRVLLRLLLAVWSILHKHCVCDEDFELLAAIKRHPEMKEEINRISEIS